MIIHSRCFSQPSRPNLVRTYYFTVENVLNSIYGLYKCIVFVITKPVTFGTRFLFFFNTQHSLHINSKFTYQRELSEHQLFSGIVFVYYAILLSIDHKLISRGRSRSPAGPGRVCIYEKLPNVARRKLFGVAFFSFIWLHKTVRFFFLKRTKNSRQIIFFLQKYEIIFLNKFCRQIIFLNENWR